MSTSIWGNVANWFIPLVKPNDAKMIPSFFEAPFSIAGM